MVWEIIKPDEKEKEQIGKIRLEPGKGFVFFNSIVCEQHLPGDVAYLTPAYDRTLHLLGFIIEKENVVTAYEANKPPTGKNKVMHMQGWFKKMKIKENERFFDKQRNYEVKFDERNNMLVIDLDNPISEKIIVKMTERYYLAKDNELELEDSKMPETMKKKGRKKKGEDEKV